MLIALFASLLVSACSAASFDGSSADLVQQLYDLDALGTSASALNVSTADLPAAVSTRLDAAQLSFEQLNGLQQRALLWAAGYVTAPAEASAPLVKVYTADGVAMSGIEVSMSDYTSAGCTYSNCTDSAGSLTLRSRYCNGDQMTSVVRCAVVDVPGSDQNLSMWATGVSNATLVPQPNVVRHDWVDDYSNESYLVFAIHMAAPSDQPSWDTCSLSSGGDYEASMIIPCAVYSEANSSQWAEPAWPAAMDAWLEAIAATSSAASDDDDDSGFNLLYLIPIIAAVVLVALGAAFGYARWRRTRDRRREWEQSDRNLDAAVASDYYVAR